LIAAPWVLLSNPEVFSAYFIVFFPRSRYLKFTVEMLSSSITGAALEAGPLRGRRGPLLLNRE
jgi:hypothetical protein